MTDQNSTASPVQWSLTDIQEANSSVVYMYTGYSGYIITALARESVRESYQTGPGGNGTGRRQQWPLGSVGRDSQADR